VKARQCNATVASLGAAHPDRTADSGRHEE